MSASTAPACPSPRKPQSPQSPMAITENLMTWAPFGTKRSTGNGFTADVCGIYPHMTGGSPNWGYLAISRQRMKSLPTWLDSAASPQIKAAAGSPSLVTAGTA